MGKRTDYKWDWMETAWKRRAYTVMVGLPALVALMVVRAALAAVEEWWPEMVFGWRGELSPRTEEDRP